MEFGDTLYIILMLAFFVFGIFNDYQKKKKKADKSTQPLNREVFRDDKEPQLPPPTPIILGRTKKQPVVPAAVPVKDVHRGFQSSMDLVTNFEGESSLKSSIFMSNLFDRSDSEIHSTDIAHPILKQMKSDVGLSEIRKAIIYSEILQRKY